MFCYTCLAHPWHLQMENIKFTKSGDFQNIKIYMIAESSDICKTSKSLLTLFESHFVWKIKNIWVIPKVSHSSKRFRLFNSTLAIAKIINWLIPSVTIQIILDNVKYHWYVDKYYFTKLTTTTTKANNTDRECIVDGANRNGAKKS